VNRKQALLLFQLSLIIFTIFISYKIYDKPSVQLFPKVLSTPNLEQIEYYTKHFDTNRSFGYLWGISDNLTLRKKEKKNSDAELQKLAKVVVRDNKICIDKDCYFVIGLLVKGDEKFTLIYSKNLKNGLESFAKDDIVADRILIREIFDNSVLFYDINTSLEWKFKFFDVNVSKYKPKDYNASTL